MSHKALGHTYGVMASLDAQQLPAGTSWDQEEQVRQRQCQSAEDQQRSALLHEENCGFLSFLCGVRQLESGRGFG